MIEYKRANNQSDLEGILALQQANLPTAISPETMKKEGFVTVEHDLELLQKMNQPFPHIVAKAEGRVVGYALVMLEDLRHDVPVLVSMFEQVDKCSYQDKSLKNSDYCVMGQVCIDKMYRGQGIFSNLYQTLKEQLKGDFEYLITEIAQRNTRSLKAHAKVGFQELDRHIAENGEIWVVVLLPLK